MTPAPWSRWTVTVTPPAGVPRHLPLEVEKRLWARFVRRLFGTDVGRVLLEAQDQTWRACAYVNSAEVLDPAYRAYAEAEIVQFFGVGFGHGTDVRIDVHLEPQQAHVIALPTIIAGMP